MNILICWIGNTDLVAAENDDGTNLGPIAQAMKDGNYARAVFLDNYRNERVSSFVKWLTTQVQVTAEVQSINLSSPTSHKEIYEAARNVVREVAHQYPEALLTFISVPARLLWPWSGCSWHPHLEPV